MLFVGGVGCVLFRGGGGGGGGFFWWSLDDGGSGLKTSQKQKEVTAGREGGR